MEKADVNDIMFKPMGKLLFVDNTGDYGQCSAQYISEYIIMTAGSCVYNIETEGWNNQFIFIQNYKDEKGKYP